MPITGDWKRLQATIRGVRALALIPAALSVEGSKAIKAEIDREFATSTDPYGNRWAPHKPATVKRWGPHPLLQLTGEGKAQIKVRPLPGAGIAIESPSEGLAFSQGGTRNQVARRFLPLDRMPKTWRLALEAVTKRKAEEALRGAR